MRVPALQDFFSVLDARSSVPERPDAITLQRATGEVRFENVAFGYPGGGLILKDVSLDAPKGKTVALVGQTGAGKSTAMSLLQRLWDPVQGRITIDGHDIRDVSLESLRANIGVVFQDAMLFNRTIRENLLVGRHDATDEEIERACRMAEAHDFITRQPRGYDTPVGERGGALSGGQKQRLAIARALLKDPPVLILDEATSALDTATEARVQRALKALMEGRTTFIIAHRLSTVRDADEILVFESGLCRGARQLRGAHRLGGRFAELVRTQLQGPRRRRSPPRRGVVWPRTGGFPCPARHRPGRIHRLSKGDCAMTIARILHAKGSDVVSVPPDATGREIAEALAGTGSAPCSSVTGRGGCWAS
jgi:ATP-binding cassette subfamily B protein